MQLLRSFVDRHSAGESLSRVFSLEYARTSAQVYGYFR